MLEDEAQIKRADQLHKEAMNLAEQAYLEQAAGQVQEACHLNSLAFEKEQQAAMLVKDLYHLEPTRSVLLRSAASLALDCNETRDAERLIAIAISGNPPEEIANELRMLLEKVNFFRHLELRGQQLLSNEFQMSLSGEFVGPAIIPIMEFRERVTYFETMIYRTAERKSGKPYRGRGPVPKDIRDKVNVYLSVPRAASFAVSFRLGTQMEFVGLGLGEEVIDEIFDCLDLVNKEDVDSLHKRITEPRYYQNFISLARQISPDGKRVEAVGLTMLRAGQERKVAFTTPRDKMVVPKFETIQLSEDITQLGEKVSIRGMMRMADSRKQEGLIDVTDKDGIEHQVQVPIAMMADIVRPLYESEVVVTGQRKGKLILLQTIDPVTS